MNGFLQNIVGMGDMSDSVIASDLLISIKSGVKMLAFAVTEAATAEARAALSAQLLSAIDMHDKIMDFMVEKGYYYPYHMQDQLHADMQAARTALKIPLPD
ncbi:spore coat protein [Heyndrickxia coagulans]|uniref:Spore coat protein n=1 Tax=Heyndrickxia coagulans TaxID=1398 RepID=A0AAW7CEV0_HEYCO|nr:spore coat protein [Heyndrickxia coagulans]MDL5041223.1 spore coat protein [Heyndrickxia coagulans]MDT9756394.1 spore coat protein [Heyndrickxia coagulans]